MKKICILTFGLLAIASASAQKALVNDAERALKSDPASYPQQIEALKPALTNPETATDVKTWFVAGKGAYDFFDKQQVLLQIGKTEVDKKATGRALIDGYNYLVTALPLDSLPDEKGKVKPKYTKDIAKMVKGHFNDYFTAADLLFNGAQDYEGAIMAWDVLTDAPHNPVLGANAPTAFPDSIVAELQFNKGIGYSMLGQHDKAYKSFKTAIDGGYHKKVAYDYAISAASQIHDNEAMAEIASLAYPLYGAEDGSYIGRIINNLIEKKQYDEAQQMLQTYIAQEPNNSQLYFVMGVLYDTQDKTDDALGYYTKAVELNPENTQAQFFLGQLYYKQASSIDENAGNLSVAEYNKLRDESIFPTYRKAAAHLEEAFRLDDSLSQARNLLRSIYYQMNDGANLERISNM